MEVIAVHRNWWVGLTAILAIYYLAVGVAIGGTTGVVALVGALLIGSSLGIRTRSRLLAAGLLVVGALALGALTWWSAVTPVLAALVLICGGVAITTAPRTTSVEAY